LTYFRKELPTFTKIRQISGCKPFPYKYVFAVHKDTPQSKVNKKKRAYRGKQLNVITVQQNKGN